MHSGWGMRSIWVDCTDSGCVACVHPDQQRAFQQEVATCCNTCCPFSHIHVTLFTQSRSQHSVLGGATTTTTQLVLLFESPPQPTVTLSWLSSSHNLRAKPRWSSCKRCPCESGRNTCNTKHEQTCQHLWPFNNSSARVGSGRDFGGKHRHQAVANTASNTTAQTNNSPDEWLARKLWLVKRVGRCVHERVCGQLAAQVALW